MKCPHCKAEWNIPGQKIVYENCPFCKKNLKVKGFGSADTLESVLLKIASSFGVETLKDGPKTLGFFLDLAPQLKKEHRLLSQFINANRESFEAIFSVRHRTESDQKIQYLKVRNKLVDEWAMQEDAAALVCKGYFCAVGISIHIEESGTRKPMQIPVAQQLGRSSVAIESKTVKPVIDKSNIAAILVSRKDLVGKLIRALKQLITNRTIDVQIESIEALEN